MKTNKTAILLGAGGHAKSLSSIIELIGFKIISYIDPNTNEKSLFGIKIREHYDPKVYKSSNLFIGIGDNKKRKELSNQITHKVCNAIHPFSIVDKSVFLGKGTQIFPGVVINKNASIGNHTIINTNSTIEHDTTIGDFVHIAPGVVVCGSVKIGDETLIGANSTILPNCKIGKNVIVGAGSTIIRSIPDNSIVVGSPGKLIKKNNL